MSRSAPHPDLLALLRDATRERHDALEGIGPAAAIVDGSVGPGGYEAVIAWQRSAHAVAEVGLAGFDWPGDAYAYRARGGALGAEAIQAEVVSLPAIAPPDSTAAAVGRAYVLDGSALGGNLILGHLRRNPRLAAYAPFPFYAFQREIGLAQWRAFAAFAKTVDWPEDQRATAVCEARRVFDVFAAAYAATLDADAPTPGS